MHINVLYFCLVLPRQACSSTLKKRCIYVLIIPVDFFKLDKSVELKTISDLKLLNLRVGVCTMIILQTNFKSKWGTACSMSTCLFTRELLPDELHHFNSACLQWLIQCPSQRPTIHLIHGDEIETGEKCCCSYSRVAWTSADSIPNYVSVCLWSLVRSAIIKIVGWAPSLVVFSLM